MDGWKKYIMFGIIIIFFISSVTGFIQFKRAKLAYNELANRYTIITESNTKLRISTKKLQTENQRLINNNKRNRQLVLRGQNIIKEFKQGINKGDESIKDSLQTINRIKKNLETLGQLVRLFE